MGEGDDRARAVDHEDQGRRAPGAQVLRVDWRLHPRLALDVPADVDLEAGVRRVWALDRAPQVLLSNERRCRTILPTTVVGLSAPFVDGELGLDFVGASVITYCFFHILSRNINGFPFTK